MERTKSYKENNTLGLRVYKGFRVTYKISRIIF